jgi:hypothetical protein
VTIPARLTFSGNVFSFQARASGVSILLTRSWRWCGRCAKTLVPDWTHKNCLTSSAEDGAQCGGTAQPSCFLKFAILCNDNLKT